MKLRTRASFAFAAALMSQTSLASAQALPPKRDPAAAEALWRQGRELRAAGRIQEACPKFEESYRLDPALGALLNLASCHELEGRTATAWAEYRDAEEQARRAADKKRAAFAKKHADALEPKLPKLTLVVTAPAEGLQVSRDGVALGAASLGGALPVDPGSHAIAAKAPGHVAWSTQIEIAPGEKKRIEVPALAPAPAPVAPVVAPPPEPATKEPGPRPDAEPAKSGNDARTAAWIFGGVAVAGLGAGITFGILTGSATSAAHDACPNDVCGPGGQAELDRAKAYAWGSDIGFAVAGAAGVTSMVLFLVSPKPATAAVVTVSPTVGGAVVTARF